MTSPASAEIPKFNFLHAGSNKPLAWPKYKLKECWTLILCLLQLPRQESALIVHNWYGGTALKFTRDFRDRRAPKANSQLQEARIIEAHALAQPLRFLALGLAVFLALLPVAGIVTITRMLLPAQLKTLVVYCDGHLSGFALVLAARARGSQTLTLHHGLYRNDDQGSIMGIRNFVADRICLWDVCTRQSFVDAGVAQERLLQVGEYGFDGLSSTEEQQTDLALLCPPYDAHQFEVFKHLNSVLPTGIQAVWSLHPMLRAEYRDLPQVTVAAADPRPSVAICGDSGALMDALARHIPIVTVADRQLSGAHLTLQEAKTVDQATLKAVIDRAGKSLAADREFFGFDLQTNKTDGMMA